MREDTVAELFWLIVAHHLEEANLVIDNQQHGIIFVETLVLERRIYGTLNVKGGPRIGGDSDVLRADPDITVDIKVSARRTREVKLVGDIQVTESWVSRGCCLYTGFQEPITATM